MHCSLHGCWGCPGNLVEQFVPVLIFSVTSISLDVESNPLSGKQKKKRSIAICIDSLVDASLIWLSNSHHVRVATGKAAYVVLPGFSNPLMLTNALVLDMGM